MRDLGKRPRAFGPQRVPLSMGVRPDVYVGGGALNSMCKAPHGRYVPVDERYVASNSFRNEKRNEGERGMGRAGLSQKEVALGAGWGAGCGLDTPPVRPLHRPGVGRCLAFPSFRDRGVEAWRGPATMSV